jgi:DNA-binding IclR family transcriptional regulator
MNKGPNNSVSRTIQILKCLFENDFQGKTETAISSQLKIPLSTVFRMLNTLKSLGWVDDYPVDGSKIKEWKINGTVLIKIANRYEESALRKVHAIEKEYLEVTGKELRR